MKRLLAALVLISASRISIGCSYDLRLLDTVEKKFWASDIVVLAEVTASAREQFQYKNGMGVGTREVVNFRVLEVFMGDIERGSKMVTSTDVGGSCSLNVLNSPPFLESVDGPVRLGKLWLLYLKSGHPYELGRTPGSFPLMPGSNELAELRRLEQKYGPKRTGSNAGRIPDTSLARALRPAQQLNDA